MAFQGLWVALGPRIQELTMFKRKGMIDTPSRKAPKLAITFQKVNSGS